MKFVNLADYPSYIDEVVSWIYAEWGDQEKNNRNFWDSWIRSSLSREDIPQTFIVLDGEELVGTYSLWRCDLQSRQDIYPWLGGIVVKKARRRQGIGLAIQKNAVEQLIKLGFKIVYLFTELTGYYEKTGWVFAGEIPDEKGEMVRLYQKYL